MTYPMFKTLSDKARLSSLATDIIAARLHEDIHKSGEASLMVSGGSTPGALYQNLSNIYASLGSRCKSALLMSAG